MSEEIANLLEFVTAGEWGNNQGAPGGVDTGVIRSANFTKDHQFNTKEIVVRSIEERKRQKKMLQYGDILIEKSGGSPDQPVGRVLFYDLKGEHTCSNFISILRPSQQVDPRFLYYSLCNLYGRGVVRSYQQQTTGIINLQLGEYLRENIYHPSLPEQKKIAEILSGIDRHIVSVQKKVEKNNLLAECLLEDLIGALLYENASNTEVRQIQDIATIKGGKRMPKGEPFADTPTPYPYLRVSDMKDLSIDTRNLKYATEKAQRQIKKYTISSKDVYITIAGSIGVVGMIPCDLNGALLTENAAKISATSEHILPRYLMYCLASSAVQRQFREETGTGGGVPKLALFRIGNSSIPICSIETQQRIVRSMDGIAEEARILSSMQNLLASIKKGLSSDLLSGRKRVNV